MKIDPTDFPAIEDWFEAHVSYGETDAAGVVYYGEYFHWFERARGHFLRRRGASYAQLSDQGFLLPVRHADCRYLRPARYDDLIAVRTGVAKLGRASMRIVYQVWGPGREHILAVGETEHACTNPEGRPVAMPAWFREKLAQ
jgi:acyl-CoA thioester hydrolase